MGGISCVVCKNSQSMKHLGKGISFHKFSRDEILRNKWCLAVNRIGIQPKKQSYICSVHFKSTDFDTSPLDRGKQRVRNRLKKDAVPSIFTSGSSSLPQEPQEKPHFQAQNHEEEPFAKVTTTLPRTFEINVTKLAASQPSNISEAENDPLAIATCDEAQTTDQQLEQKHDISNVEVETAVQRIVPSRCGVCKYQAKSEEDLKQHLFEEIRQLQSNKISHNQHLHTVKATQKSSKDQKQSGFDIRDKTVYSRSKDVCCTQCEYQAKNEEDLKKHHFQNHQIHKVKGKPINQSHDEEEHIVLNTAEKETYSMKKDIPCCGVCNYQAKNEDDLRQHLFEEIRQLRLNKISHNQSLHREKTEIATQKSRKDQEQSGFDMRYKTVSPGSKEVVCCTECKYQAKNEEDLKKHHFQNHQVHKGEGKHIIQSDDEEEHVGLNTGEKEAYLMKKDVSRCGVCNYRAKNEDDLRQHLFEEIRQQQVKKSEVPKNQKDENHTSCSNFFIDMALIQEGTIMSHCGCREESRPRK